MSQFFFGAREGGVNGVGCHLHISKDSEVVVQTGLIFTIFSVCLSRVCRSAVVYDRD